MPYNIAGKAVINGLSNEIKSIKVVGGATNLSLKVVGKISWSQLPGIVYVANTSTAARVAYITVMEIKLKDKLSLYRRKGRFQ